MTSNEDFLRISAFGRQVLDCPRRRCSRILDAVGYLNFGAKAVSRSNDRDALVLQGFGDLLLTARQTTAVKPNDCSEILCGFWDIDIQFAPVPNTVRDVTLQDVLSLPRQVRDGSNEQ